MQLGKSHTPLIHGLSLFPDEMKTCLFNHPLYLQYCLVLYSIVFLSFNCKCLFPVQVVWLWFIVIVWEHIRCYNFRVLCGW